MQPSLLKIRPRERRGWCVVPAIAAALLLPASLLPALLLPPAARAQLKPADTKRGTVAIAQASAAPQGPVTPLAWVQAATDREIHIIEDDGSFPLAYRVRKVDERGDITREVIESREGSVARLVERDGRTLTRQEDSDERGRLAEILSHPDDFLRHHKRDDATRAYSVDLVRIFPRAMQFRYASGRVASGSSSDTQIVIDFEPDPSFKPPSLVAELLTGLEGRLWIDSRTHTLTRVQGHVLRPLNLGWGMLMRIHPGGTVDLEQTPVGNDRWVYSRFEDHLELREVMVHRAQQNVRMTAWNFRLLTAPVAFREAVQSLLAMRVPLQP